MNSTKESLLQKKDLVNWNTIDLKLASQRNKKKKEWRKSTGVIGHHQANDIDIMGAPEGKKKERSRKII